MTGICLRLYCTDRSKHLQVETAPLFTFPPCSAKPVIDAQVATPCGHTFCGYYVEMFQQTAGPIPCAMCRQLVVKFCRNIFANKVLATIQGKCLVCNDEFDLGTAKDHVKHCPQMEMTCSLCKETIKRIDQLVHANACPMKETCACGEIFPQKNQDEHKELSCSFKRIDCPLNCQDSVQRYLIFKSPVNKLVMK